MLPGTDVPCEGRVASASHVFPGRLRDRLLVPEVNTDESGGLPDEDGSHSVADTELAVQMGKVGVHRAWGDSKPSRNRVRGEPLSEELEDRQLSIGEPEVRDGVRDSFLLCSLAPQQGEKYLDEHNRLEGEPLAIGVAGERGQRLRHDVEVVGKSRRTRP